LYSRNAKDTCVYYLFIALLLSFDTLLSHHTVVSEILSLLFFVGFLFVFTLRICQRRKKIAEWNFAFLFDYYLRWASPILVNLARVESRWGH